MTANKQKIASILIGLAITILILVFGWQLLERQRTSASGAIENFTCSCLGTTCEVKYQNSNQESEQIVYGPYTIGSQTDASTMKFVADQTTASIEPEPGKWEHSYTLSLVASDVAIGLLSTGGDVQTNTDWVCILNNTQSPPAVATTAPTATAIPQVETEPDEYVSEVLDAVEIADNVKDFYEKNNEASIEECISAEGTNAFYCISQNPSRQITPTDSPEPTEAEESTE